MAEILKIGRLTGGGIVLGYACSSHCRHCLYNAGPHRRDGKPTPDKLEALLNTLAERAPRARYHIGGGEPFLDLTLLKQAITGMVERDLALDYVETNAAWVKDREQAAGVLKELASIGLDCVLISVSPFHAEFVPPKRTLLLIELVEEILTGGAFIWLPNFLKDLSQYPRNERLDLEALLTEQGALYALNLASRYGLIPGGRAGHYLASYGIAVPWRDLVHRAPCHSRLRDTNHFHVDGQGLYLPGFCAGLSLPLSSVPGDVPLDSYPVIQTLLAPEGLGKLVARAQTLGFVPKATYSAACHLCGHVRSFLFRTAPSPDLAPAGFYQDGDEEANP